MMVEFEDDDDADDDDADDADYDADDGHAEGDANEMRVKHFENIKENSEYRILINNFDAQYKEV